MLVAPLSTKHLGELQLATERALQQWAKGVFAPTEIVSAMERILIFLRHNGGAARQARQVASLAFIIGEQIVQLGGWRWMSVSDDGSVNPAIVSPDGARACLVVDVMTVLVAGETKASLGALVKACVENEHHALVVLV
ncbi:MAG: hypothetical protein Q8N23_00860 [Archangium sp.]|nr:hypothetical protein [Archangium sp.]MDP3151185.1 hypothetical protein [Archangium sp.]MDP3570174.1 hypothetical protein [Archangium sp.]